MSLFDPFSRQDDLSAQAICSYSSVKTAHYDSPKSISLVSLSWNSAFFETISAYSVTELVMQSLFVRLYIYIYIYYIIRIIVHSFTLLVLFGSLPLSIPD